MEKDVVSVLFCYTVHMNTMPKDQGMWNGIFSLIFVFIFALFFWGLTDGLDRFEWLYLINTADVALLSLATFRLIRLMSFDKILAFVRNWFLDEQDDGTYKKPKGGPRRTIAELVECPWCTGIWATLFASILYFSSDIGRFAVILLAVAAVGSFFQVFSAMIGRLGK